VASLPHQSSQQAAHQQLPAVFINQQINMLIELICFRMKNLTFTHRTNFLQILNTLFTSPSSQSSQSGSQQQQQQQGSQQGGQQPGAQQGQQQGAQQGQRSVDQTGIFMKNHTIYLNTHCAILKLLSSFTGADYFELLNSITGIPNKHGPKYFVSSESEEINKAIVVVIGRAVHLTCNFSFQENISGLFLVFICLFYYLAHDPNPLDNKEKEENFKGLFREIIQKTPIYFQDYALEHFPRVIQEFFHKEQQQVRVETIYADPSNKQYKLALKKKVDEDYRRFLDFRHETQVQTMFQNNAISAHTLVW
jgi:hypothetical protein